MATDPKPLSYEGQDEQEKSNVLVGKPIAPEDLTVLGDGEDFKLKRRILIGASGISALLLVALGVYGILKGEMSLLLTLASSATTSSAAVVWWASRR